VSEARNDILFKLGRHLDIENVGLIVNLGLSEIELHSFSFFVPNRLTLYRIADGGSFLKGLISFN